MQLGRRVLQQVHNGRRQRRVVRICDQPAGHTILHGIDDSPGGKRHRRQPVRSRLDSHHTEAFGVATKLPHWENVDIGSGIGNIQLIF